VAITRNLPVDMKEVAKEMDVSGGGVKEYCQRKGIPFTPLNADEANFCSCGEPIPIGELLCETCKFIQQKDKKDEPIMFQNSKRNLYKEEKQKNLDEWEDEEEEV